MPLFVLANATYPSNNQKDQSRVGLATRQCKIPQSNLKGKGNPSFAKSLFLSRHVLAPELYERQNQTRSIFGGLKLLLSVHRVSVVGFKLTSLLKLFFFLEDDEFIAGKQSNKVWISIRTLIRRLSIQKYTKPPVTKK